MDPARSISEMQASMAQCFGQLREASPGFSAEQHRRVDRLLGDMNRIHASAEAAIAAFGITAPDGARQSIPPRIGASASPSGASTISAAEIFRRRREQAQAASAAPAETSTSICSGPAPVTRLDAASIFARRAQQRAAILSTSTEGNLDG